MTKKIDHLTEDKPIPGQLYVCMSFLSPEGIKNCTLRGLKIRGVFGSLDAANARAKELSEIDPDFHVFVGEVGKWLPWDPDPNAQGDQVYQEEELQKLMVGHKENMTKAKRMQEQRKKDMIEDAAREDAKVRNKTHARLKQKLEQRRKKKAEENTNQEVEEIKKEEEIATKEKERLAENEKAIKEVKNNVSNIDSKLDKIKSLYNKIHK